MNGDHMPKTGAVHLVQPRLRYREQYYEVQSEYHAAGEEATFGLHFAEPDFEDVLKAVGDWAKGVDIPVGEGRRKVFWLVRDHDDRLLGTLNIRSLETEYFVTVGGNIGYSVRPTERRKGYATRMLSLALDECRRSGLETALVTCNPGNAASIGTITKNGGMLEGEATDQEGVRYLRFKIDLKDRPAERFVLRPPNPGDMGWIIHRHGALYSQEYGWDWTFEALVAQIVADFVAHYRSADERCWIAEMDGKPVGSVMCVRSSDDAAKLRLLLVEPTARGLGIGKRLVDECVTFAREAGYRKLALWTSSILVEARRLYSKAGFVPVSTEAEHSFGHDLLMETWELTL